jgi:exodeoxyribonuclease VII large subunit
MRFDSVYSDCNIAIQKQMEGGEKRLGLAAAALDALSPLAVLQRGYAIAQHQDGRLLRDAEDAAVGDLLKVRLAKGALSARVEEVEESQ